MHFNYNMFKLMFNNKTLVLKKKWNIWALCCRYKRSATFYWSKG